MASLLSLLMLSLPVSLLAAGTGSLTCQLTDIQLPTVEGIALQTQQIHTELTEFKQHQTEYQQRVEQSLQDLKKALEDLAGSTQAGPTQSCFENATYSVEGQVTVSSRQPGERRRVICGEDAMVIGISDNHAFTDLDNAKCVHYDSIHLGDEHDLPVPANAEEYISCGPNEVVTAFGGSDDWMDVIVYVTCRNVTSGAVVSDECQDFAVTGSMGATNDHPTDTRWPAQCPGEHPHISVVTGVTYNEGAAPKWQKLRCCQLACRSGPSSCGVPADLPY